MGATALIYFQSCVISVLHVMVQQTSCIEIQIKMCSGSRFFFTLLFLTNNCGWGIWSSCGYADAVPDPAANIHWECARQAGGEHARVVGSGQDWPGVDIWRGLYLSCLHIIYSLHSLFRGGCMERHVPQGVFTLFTMYTVFLGVAILGWLYGEVCTSGVFTLFTVSTVFFSGGHMEKPVPHVSSHYLQCARSLCKL